MTTHITKEGLLRVLTEDVSEPMRSFILARAAELSAQDTSPKDGPEPQQILVLNEQGVHAAIERTEDGKWKFSTYPDGSLFIRFPSPKDGWKLVPVEYTDAQIERAIEGLRQHRDAVTDEFASDEALAGVAYDLMLAAAPEPPND